MTSHAPKSVEKLSYCSFCGKSQHEVHHLICGPTVFICDECVVLCTDIIRDHWHERLETAKISGSESENAPFELLYHCSFCGKSRRDVDKLLIGRPLVYICDKCVELCAGQLESTEIGDSEPRAICSFCRKRPRDVCKLVRAQTVDICDGRPIFICDECVDLYMAVINAKSKRLVNRWLCP